MIVQIEEGRIRGVEKKSILTDQPFCAFLGIPYAKPPIGDLRFKAPVPIEKWGGIRDASKEGGRCIQMEFATVKPEIVGTEDCLYLNVFTPRVPSEFEKKKAVMVYIHGGGFSGGSGSPTLYGPDFIIDHDIIYVTMNYRLHVFGFLNTGTPSCPGNAGLKDQQLALKWVKRNIANFGGDPDNITLFGESAGAVSVHLHMLSPLSKGLFNKSIIQSGSALCPWAVIGDSESQARKIGELAGYRGKDLKELVQYLRDVPSKKLCELAQRCFEDVQQNIPGRCSTLVFVPSVERIKDGAFLPDYPEKLIESAVPIPTIIGYTDQEGILFFISQARESMDLLLNDISLAVKNNFHLDPSTRAELVEKIKTFYFHNKPITRASVAQLIDMYTDLYFMKFYEAFDYLIKSDVPPYVYLFAHDGKLNFIKNLVSNSVDFTLRVKGAAHGDSAPYLLSQTVVPTQIDEVDGKVINSFCTLWTNFAKTGHPTSSHSIDWKPHTKRHPCYLKIEEPLKVFNEKLFEERLNFWRNWSKTFHR